VAPIMPNRARGQRILLWPLCVGILIAQGAPLPIVVETSP